MHTNTQRLFTISSILFNAVTILLFVTSLLSYVYEKQPSVSNLKIVSLQPFSSEFKGRNIILNPQTDLTDVFHLNVKQIFLYVKMIAGDKKEMIWSQIVQKNDIKNIDKSFVNNYRFFEIPKGTNVSFELRGCIFPFVGLTKDKLFSKTTYKVPIH
ncbi:Signal peptidase complex subunit [Pseudoloma neurophilia]|uniref:Signal peptidase complex subunit 3 n=1 Tax=Pseudoloma neurophilia TaxID=146866 RepID=A0A0R0M697_9MICR|nr:Signal peptidase complex subunit [Pseudoloma neurophilia]